MLARGSNFVASSCRGTQRVLAGIGLFEVINWRCGFIMFVRFSLILFLLNTIGDELSAKLGKPLGARPAQLFIVRDRR